MDKLNRLLKDFYSITGIRITIFDENYVELTSYPECLPEICRYIRTSKRAETACRACDIQACNEARRRHSTYVYRCHAGLTEAVAPVYLGNIAVAYLLFGHIFSYKTFHEGWEEVRGSCRDYHLDERALREMVKGMTRISDEYILSSAHILLAVASYLCMERMITLRQKGLLVEINDYINAHFTEEISAGSIAAHFNIGKTMLYKISRQNYGVGIAERIRSLRIEYAKELLSSDTGLSISDIAEKCGFTDYNYFISVFKRLTQTTPLKYRKQNLSR